MSLNDILWRESWINIRLMLADAPRFVPAGNTTFSAISDSELLNLSGL